MDQILALIDLPIRHKVDGWPPCAAVGTASNPRPLKVVICFALPAASQKYVSSSFSVQGTNTAFSSRTCNTSLWVLKEDNAVVLLG